MKIKKIGGRQILDSRGWPTIECILELEDGRSVKASVPAGASVGKYEAKELRDDDVAHFSGRGVLKAIAQLEQHIAPLLVGKAPDIVAMDKVMIQADGTADKSRFGANAILAVSIAVIRAQALIEEVELYDFINRYWSFDKPSLPICMFNIINGGMHALSGLIFQEFMVMPTHGSFSQRLEDADKIYHELGKLLLQKKYSTALGDEGGFCPGFGQNGILREKAALDLLVQSSQISGVSDVAFCLDVAASCLYNHEKRSYRLYASELYMSNMIDFYQSITAQYPIVSIEDGLDEDDWDGWAELTAHLGSKIQLVGDDLFVTNIDRIAKGIESKVANAVLIKPNQIGTVSETIQAIQLCQKNKYKTIISHRSGETNDTFIADLAVGTAAGQLKSGSPVRGERVAKYNRLLEISEKLERS